MNPGIGIMTVPVRKNMAIALSNELKQQGVNAYICVDKDLKGCWFNWKCTASIIKENKHSHALVLQDDVILCKNFYKEYLKVLKQESNKLISLFTPYKEPKGLHFKNKVVSAQGISIPTRLLNDLFSWVIDNEKPDWDGDDWRLNAWCFFTKQYCAYPIPTLIDHNVEVETTLGPNHIMQANGKYWNSKDFKGNGEAI